MDSPSEIELTLETGNIKLDLFWLRDHCRCELCYDHVNYQRKTNILDIPDDVGIMSHVVEGEKLQVVCK
jgi:hypothetical protein